MDNPTAQIGAGDVEIILDGETLVLKPTYNAARLISNTAGGIRGAIERVMALDVDTISQVISLGLGYGQGNRSRPADLPEKIWRQGFTDDTGKLVEKCALYLRVLAAGGRMPKDETPSGEDNDPSR